MSIESIPWVLCALNILLNGLVFVLLHKQTFYSASVIAFLMFSIDLNIFVWCQPFTRAVELSFLIVMTTFSLNLSLVPLCHKFFQKENTMKLLTFNKTKAVSGGCPGISQFVSPLFFKHIRNRDEIFPDKRPLFHRLDDKTKL